MTQASPCPLPADAGFLAPPRHLASYTYPGSPSALAVDAAGGVLLLGDTSTRKLLRYSTRRETPQLVGKSLPVNGAFGIALDTNAQRAYVSTADGIVAVDFSGDAARQVGTPVGLRNVEGMAVDPGTGRLYAPEYAEGRLHAYDWTGDALAEAGSPVDVGRRPQQLAIDPSRHRAYVVNVADGTVSVVDISGPPRVSATVAVGRAPYGVAVDPVSHRVFVAGQAEGSVTVIDGCRDPAAHDLRHRQADVN
ncbi:MAG: hypothetical protein QOE92_232, partial [Chloroflexota bacterium]|nr:hypothetical protein [Chloroflexota bacterium]